jgi:hypothetical protein
MIMRPLSATVLLSKPLHYKSPTKCVRSKRNETIKWTPAKNDPDRVDDWYHVGDLVMRWYIDQGPVPIGKSGENMITKELGNLYKSVFGADAAPLSASMLSKI